MYRSNQIYTDCIMIEKVPASDCTQCETCIDYCTQKINIPEKLEEVCEHFQEGFSPYG